jgi:hypothetical protein
MREPATTGLPLRDEFLRYYVGGQTAHAIAFGDLGVREQGIELAQLRHTISGLQPPHTYGYLTNEDYGKLKRCFLSSARDGVKHYLLSGGFSGPKTRF